MKQHFLMFLLFFVLATASAQIHEIGVFAGGSNFIGDVGSTAYVKPNEFAFGFLYKWNRSPRHAWRFSYMQSNITAQDGNSSESARKFRNYDFQNSIKELSAGMEFNFFDFNLHDFTKKITPYIYTGIAYTNYDEKYIINGVSKTDASRYTIALPMILGLKANISKHYVLGFEVGTRYSFTDNLDGSNPKNANLKPFQFGNLESNDWYVFSGFTLSYTFGEKPCYCSN